MTSEPASLRAIYRYPVKGLSPQSLKHSRLAVGKTIPADRLYAIENGPCGFDHAGYPLRDRLLQEIRDLGHEVLDFGTDRPSPPIDYPDKALEVGHAVASGDAERGIIVCGSGAGVSVAAGKIRGVRACTIHDHYTAHQGVEHDGVNVLCLGGRVIGVEEMVEIVAAFLGAVVSDEERHVRRRAKVEEIERTMGDVSFPADLGR